MSLCNRGKGKASFSKIKDIVIHHDVVPVSPVRIRKLLQLTQDEKSRIAQFNSWQVQSKDWPLMKTFTKYNMEIKRLEDDEVGIPKFYMRAELPDITAQSIYELFTKGMLGKPKPH
jgi:hypothetical protein